MTTTEHFPAPWVRASRLAAGMDNRSLSDAITRAREAARDEAARHGHASSSHRASLSYLRGLIGAAKGRGMTVTA